VGVNVEPAFGMHGPRNWKNAECNCRKGGGCGYRWQRCRVGRVPSSQNVGGLIKTVDKG
jgi:hypothetical protein